MDFLDNILYNQNCKIILRDRINEVFFIFMKSEKKIDL